MNRNYILLIGTCCVLMFAAKDPLYWILLGLNVLNVIATNYELRKHTQILEWFARHVHTGGPKPPKDLESLMKQ